MIMKTKFDDYPLELRPLSEAEGGGWLITWPDLPGCMSDGKTAEEALENGRDAFAAWMSVHQEDENEYINSAEKGFTFASTLGLVCCLVLFAGLIYAGNTGIWNNPNIIYTGTDPATGKVVAKKGCRPERVQPEGSCDSSFRLSEFFKK